MKDTHDFHLQIYEASLETCLQMFVDEDRDAHGRLIEMKNILLNIDDQYELICKRLKLYFYAKDIEAFYGRIGETTPTVIENMNLSDITDVQFHQILQHRRGCSTYKKTSDPV
ncbi:unnamed protein product [Adineta steineri]|uniref:Uncharacterized protein n=1 Tax=Adineta steineri TaxID=433720 RepID=A0A813NS24_9BILA|nr:unnamed protein product [Adineta steineri]CAF0972524.1 unnamed protein product [Adineta steineri]